MRPEDDQAGPVGTGRRVEARVRTQIAVRDKKPLLIPGFMLQGVNGPAEPLCADHRYRVEPL